MPEELWIEVCDIAQKAVIKTIPKKKRCKKAKWLSEKALQMAEKRREDKGKGEKIRYTHLNAEFQRIAKRLGGHRVLKPMHPTKFLGCNSWTLPFPIPAWSLLKLMSIESVMSSNHLIMCLQSQPEGTGSSLKDKSSRVKMIFPL